jgi:hypothetical protein
VLLVFASLRRCSPALREPARRIGGYVCMGGSPCTAVTPTCTDKEEVQTAWDLKHSGAAHHPHPGPARQISRSLQGVPPSCCGRRAAVWSGGCSSRPSRAGKRHDVQAACEPGGRGCGGVPDHPPRLPTHRTSPAQALLTTLIETWPASPTFDLLSHCHRRGFGVQCALA